MVDRPACDALLVDPSGEVQALEQELHRRGHHGRLLGPVGHVERAEIADRVLLSRSGLTRLVDRLVELGYVTRCASENDRRGAPGAGLCAARRAIPAGAM